MFSFQNNILVWELKWEVHHLLDEAGAGDEKSILTDDKNDYYYAKIVRDYRNLHDSEVYLVFVYDISNTIG